MTYSEIEFLEDVEMDALEAWKWIDRTWNNLEWK